ncbi:MAG: hypothetical protein BroJett040_17120 [Oligoflexia bacterium]|nr:MAG: hypothetical protein BroJett040_17120 [Oligoflexia bacterium]
MSQFTRFAIILDQIEGAVVSQEDIKGHIAYLRRLEKEGILVMAGPFTNYKGGMVVINVPTLEDAQKIAATDPFVANKVRRCEIRQWELSCEENNHLGRG